MKSWIWPGGSLQPKLDRSWATMNSTWYGRTSLRRTLPVAFVRCSHAERACYQYVHRAEERSVYGQLPRRATRECELLEPVEIETGAPHAVQTWRVLRLCTRYLVCDMMKVAEDCGTSPGTQETLGEGLLDALGGASTSLLASTTTLAQDTGPL